MKKLTLFFAHGKESSPNGVKIQHLSKIASKYDIKLVSPDYSYTFDPDVRVEKLLSICNVPQNNLILVGSSMGGYVSAVASEKLKPIGMFLMAPAFCMQNYKQQEPVPYSKNVWIIHGFNDEIVPYENSVKYAEKFGCSLHLLNSEHTLNDSILRIGNLFDLFLNEIISA